MQFLSSPTSQDQIAVCGTEGLFESVEGSLFNYRVTFEEDEMITVTDSVGRYVPLDISEVDDLIDVLVRISNFQKWKAVFQEALIQDLTYGADIEA